MSSSRRLKVVVDVPNPCEVDWEDMVGDDRGRHCAQCGKTVRNLSVLDGDEIAEVLARGDCVSFLYREDASIITAPSASPAGAAFGVKATAVVLAATMALTLGCDVGRTSGEPAPVASAAAVASSEVLPGSGGRESAAAATSAVATSAGPAASGGAVSPSASAEAGASCEPTAKAVKGGNQVPSERPRRTAGKPILHRDPDIDRF